MGIENRDYIRDDDSGVNWSARGRSLVGRTSSMVITLIVVTVAVYILQVLTVNRGAASSTVQTWLELRSDAVLFRGQIWRLLSYAFVHSQTDLLHLIFNMMMLYSIGSIVRDLLGDREFLWYYLVAAVFSGICSMTFYRLAGMPVSIVGASGAVLAVFCLAALHYPRQQVLVMGMVPVEFRWLLAIFVAIDCLPIVTGQIASSRTANSAHLGGLLFGFLYYQWSMRLTRWWDQFAGRMAVRRKSRGKLKLFAPATQPEVNLSEQVDAILEKISREGEASLTDRERKVLTTASQQLRKSRE